MKGALFERSPRASWMLVGLALFGALLGPGCAKTEEVIVETAAGRRASDADVDGDPWRLLPGGAVSWARLDGRALARASFAAEVDQLLSSHLPLAGGEGIDFAKDIDEILLGVYATAGADVAAVARGRFDVEQLNAAIANKPEAAGGAPIVKNPFAGRDVLVSGGWAMVPVTKSTLVFGTEIGVRRVLERIEEGRLKRNLPSWFEELLAVKASTFTWGIDLDAQAVPSVVRTRLSFLQGLRAGRLLGNFEEPGLNLAGTLTYDTPASATAAASALEQQAEDLRRAELLLAIVQMPRPLRRLEARPTGKDTQVVVEIDGRAIGVLLGQVDKLIEQTFPDEDVSAASAPVDAGAPSNQKTSPDGGAQ